MALWPQRLQVWASCATEPTERPGFLHGLEFGLTGIAIRRSVVPSVVPTAALLASDGRRSGR